MGPLGTVSTDCVAQQAHSDRLSTIPEEDSRVESDGITEIDLVAMFGQYDPSKRDELVKAYLAIKFDDETCLKELDLGDDLGFCGQPREEEDDVGDTSYHLSQDVSWNETDKDGIPCVHLEMDPFVAKFHMPVSMYPDAQHVLLVYAGGVKTSVIKGDTDILTKEE